MTGQSFWQLTICCIVCAFLLAAHTPMVASARLISTVGHTADVGRDEARIARALLQEEDAADKDDEDGDEEADEEEDDEDDEDEDEEDEDEEDEDEDEDEDEEDVVEDEESADTEAAEATDETTEPVEDAAEPAEEETAEDVAEAAPAEAKMSGEETTEETTTEETTVEEEAVETEATEDVMEMPVEDGAAADELTCPIDLEAGSTSEDELMSEFLETLVTPCTATAETSTDPDLRLTFCKSCVRPLQTFLAREFHLADLMRGDDETWDSGSTAIHEKCAADACAFLESKGMPYDDNFHAAVLECANFAEDPACEMTADELLETADIKQAVEKCQEHADKITKPEAMGAEDSAEVSTGDYLDTHPFCNGCYWPFFESIVKTTISEEFMCKIKGEDLTPLEMERQVIEDPHMFACLLNVEGKLREDGKQTASIGYTEMEEICFNDLNHPLPGSETPILMEWLKHDDMVKKMDELTC